MEPTIYFDMDGLLCHFVKGVIAHHKSDLDPDAVVWGLEAQMGIDPETFWGSLGYDFWRNLEPYADGFALLAHAEALVGTENIAVLSAPCNTAGCVDGKWDWVRHHLPGYERRCFFGKDKAVHAGPNKLLIDDHVTNCANFTGAGGCVVMPPRPWNPRKGECGYPGGTFDVDRVFAEVVYAVAQIKEL